MEAEILARRIVDLLVESGDASRSHQLLTLIIDDLLEAPGGDFIDADFIAQQLVAALRSAGPTIVAERHLEPSIAWERARVAKSAETLQDYIPQSVLSELEERLTRPSALPDGFGKDIIDPAFLRQLIAGSLTETLEAFLSKLPFGGGGKENDGGLLGSIARRGASRIKNASSAISALSSGMQEGLKRQAKEFAQQSADRLKQGVVERFQSSENKAALKQMRRRAVDAVLGLELSQLHALTDDPGLAALRQWGDWVVQHNLQRPEIQEAICEQVVMALKRDELRSAKDLLTDFGIYEDVRAHLIEIASQRTRDFVQGDSFQAWLESLLEDAMS